MRQKSYVDETGQVNQMKRGKSIKGVEPRRSAFLVLFG